jgi:NADH oxidase (H2O2-forming)
MARIVIIGLGAGGFAAILSARKTSRDAEVAVIDEKDYDLMHPCGIPYVVEGAIGDFTSLKHDVNLPGMRVAHYKNYRASGIDVGNKTVIATNLFSGEDEKISYDKLIIASGSTAIVPPIDGLHELMDKGAYTVSNPDEAERLRTSAKATREAVVLGAGAIGLEIASALSDIGCKVTLVEMLGHVFPRVLDPDTAGVLEQYLQDEKKIVLKLGARLESVRGKGKVEEVVVNGETIPCGMLVVAAGVKPNIEIAREAGIETTPVGIVTDERMATSAPGIYAVGDCARTFDALMKKPCWMPLSTVAYRQGTVAGANAAGGEDKYAGVAGAFVSKVGEMEVASVGFSVTSAEQAGFKPVFGKIKDLTRPDWYPNGRVINFKIVADRKTRRVLGAQAIGVAGAAWRVNVVSTAMMAGMTLDQLAEVELAYCPPVSQTYDTITKAVDLAIRKIK